MRDTFERMIAALQGEAAGIAEKLVELQGRLLEYKLALMEDALGGDPAASPGGPGEGTVVELGSLLAGEGIVPGPGDIDESPEGIILVTPRSVETLRFVREHCRRVAPEGAPGRVPVGGSDIVMVARGERAGACAIMPVFFEGGVLGPGCLRITLRSDLVEPFYLVNFLHHRFRRDSLEGVMSHNGGRSVSVSLLGKLPVPLASLDEQKRIAGELLGVSGLMVKAEEARERVEELLADLV